MHHQLVRLLAENRRQFTPIDARIDAAAGEPTIYVYDPIVGDRATAEYFGGVCPQDFVPALNKIDAPRVKLRINSPGGDVFAAQAMAQAIREHKAHIIGVIDGVAASAATVIACACDEVEIAPGALYMIHKSHTMAYGNADSMRECAGLLDKVDATLIAEYVRATGKDEATITEWVTAETWFKADEAVQHGFAARVAGASAPKAQAAWNLSAYAKAPAQEPPQEPAAPAEPPAASDDHIARQQQRIRLLGVHRIE